MDIMRRAALMSVSEAFAECGNDIFSIAIIFSEVCSYAKREGLVALCESEVFRQKGEPHILNVIEERGISVQLKNYLLFGFSCICSCDRFEELDVLMKNKYYANSYKGKDLFIGFAYYLFIHQLAHGDSIDKVLQHFSSILPDASTESFKLFLAANLKTDEKNIKSMGGVVQFRQKKE